MFCPNCGTQNADGSAFCSNCGAALAVNNNQVSQQASYQSNPAFQQIATGNSQPQQNYQQTPDVANAQNTGYNQVPNYNAQNTTYNQVPNYNAPNYQYPVTPAQPNLPMNWFKFLIYFSLFAGGVLDIISGFSLISGISYGEYKNYYYSFFGGLQAFDIIFGLMTIGVGVYLFITRFQLSGYKKKGPMFAVLVYAINAGVTLIQLIGYIIILGDSFDFSSSIFSRNVIMIIVNLAMVFANKVYFDKRKHLFVN